MVFTRTFFSFFEKLKFCMTRVYQKFLFKNALVVDTSYYPMSILGIDLQCKSLHGPFSTVATFSLIPEERGSWFFSAFRRFPKTMTISILPSAFV